MATILTTSPLDERFRGRLIRRGDVGYDEHRRVWNGAIDKEPALIARCATTEDVRLALTYARERDLLVAVRGGGHSIPGYSTCDGGVLIDLGPMKGIRVDPDTRRAVAQPGLWWGEYDRATQAFGLASPGGEISDTGVAGLTLGGGIGWLSRLYGLACDNLVAADVLTAEGDLVRASDEENPDLFWGLRGGGGNFGIVTSLEFALHEVGPITGGMVVYPLELADDVLAAIQAFAADASPAFSLDVALIVAPPAPFLPESLHGRPALAVVPAWIGPLDEGEQALRSLRQVGPPAADLVEPIPYLGLQSMFDDFAPRGARYYVKSEWLQPLGADARRALVDAAASITSPGSQILLRLMGGAVADVDDDATAFGGRGAEWMLTLAALWEDPIETERHVEWTRSSWEELLPTSTGGAYVNHLGEEGQERIRAAYGRKWDRLVDLKRRWDPDNVFRLNQNIPPA
jgi:FAD/FMN-containing dehydrogenase